MYSSYNRPPAADVQVGTPAPPPPPPRHCETACHCPTPPTHVRALASKVSISPPHVASLRRHPSLFVHTSQIERIGDLLERKPEDGEVGDVWYARHISSHSLLFLTPPSSHVGLLPASDASARQIRALNLGRFGQQQKRGGDRQRCHQGVLLSYAGVAPTLRGCSPHLTSRHAPFLCRRGASTHTPLGQQGGDSAQVAQGLEGIRWVCVSRRRPSHGRC
jgi:hypothetical protein